MSRVANRLAWRVRPHPSGPRPPVAGPVRLDRLCAAAILAMMGLEIVFLIAGCGWDLCGDEAEYWAWSRHLDWSYFAKGPLVAWVIRGGTALAGDWVVHLTGTMMPAVRLPAVLLGGLTAWGVFRLATRTCQDPRVGMIAVLLLPAVPLFAAGGVLMTIDTPFICCWTWAAIWAYAGADRDELRGWAIAGLIAALGVLAKYTMLAFPASVGLFLLLSRRHRRQLARPGFWLMALACGLGMAPIVAWNVRHQWVGAGHLASRVGLTHSTWGGGGPVLRFLGGEAAALGGVWLLIGLHAAFRAARRVIAADFKPAVSAGRASDAGLLYLLCLGAVVWSACLAASLLGVTQPNWAAPAYVSGLVLIGWRIATVVRSAARRQRACRWFYTGCWGASLACALALHHTEWFYPALAPLLPRPTAAQPAPIRRFDPTCRMRGYQALAAEVDRRLAAVRAGGGEPFVLTPAYGLAASLSFYLAGQPEVYCLGGPAGLTPAVGTQHDIWRPNPRLDPGAFWGRPAVVVEPAGSTQARSWLNAGLFDRAAPTSTIVVEQRGVAVAAWNITVCRDYRGIGRHDPGDAVGDFPVRRAAPPIR